MALLQDRQFYDYCKILKMPANVVPSDPDKKQIEKAFRKIALKTHPDKVRKSEAKSTSMSYLDHIK